MLISSAFFILIVTLLCLGVVYYWSFFHFSHLFEDRVIDQLTFQKNQDMGIKNEWILGVTTDSIDVVEGIHGAKVAQQIQEHAHEQEEVKELYRETIDEKHLLYTIELNTKNGETLYKYSIIKDIYTETFPQIAAFLFVFAIIIVGISFIYSNSLSRDFYKGISRLRSYSKEIAQGKHIAPIDIETCDQEFRALAEDLEIMRCSLEKNDENRQQVLQYISHELKTPLTSMKVLADSINSMEDAPIELYKEFMGDIGNEVDRETKIINDLLSLVKMDKAAEDREYHKYQYQ